MKSKGYFVLTINTDVIKPTPIKISIGGLCVSLLLSLIVIGLEVKKPALSNSMNLYHLSCVSTGQMQKKRKVLRLFLECKNHQILQPVIDKSFSDFNQNDGYFDRQKWLDNVTANNMLT